MQNYLKALDIIRQLYWEAKRAPVFLLNQMSINQRRKLKVKLFGKTKSDREKNIAKIKVSYEKDVEKFGKIENFNLTRKEFLDLTKDKNDEYMFEAFKKVLSKEKQLPEDFDEKFIKEYGSLDLTNYFDSLNKNTSEDTSKEKSSSTSSSSSTDKNNEYTNVLRKNDVLKNFGGLSEKAYNVFYKNNTGENKK